MVKEEQGKRLSKLNAMPVLAGLDHRHFLNGNGEDSRLAGLSRHEKRKIAKEGKKIGQQYRKIMLGTYDSGAGFLVDQFLRQMAVEYTNRFASSGIHNQPMSFNYIEPFCRIDLISGSFAPYAVPATEIDHQFNLVDFLNYATDPELGRFDIGDLNKLPDGKVLHFTTNGDLLDFTMMVAGGQEFVVAGFSMVRRGGSLHWYLVGGQIHSEEEWAIAQSDQPDIELDRAPAHKRAFLRDAIKERESSTTGPPLSLEGAERALKTIVSGETDLATSRHLGRCLMAEHENTFQMVCDDPDIFSTIRNQYERMTAISKMMERVEAASVLWNIAETMFLLPKYF